MLEGRDGSGKKSPPMGIEPTIFGSGIRRAARYATEA